MIKVFILTYNNPTDLNNNLKSLFDSSADMSEIEVHVINNHSINFKLDTEFIDQVIVHQQSLRANWGCGTPARDWNQALVLGFKSLVNPDCDQIILCQDDCLWDKDWKHRLDSIHKKYTFYQCSWGDCFISVLPEAIRKIGLYDERICTLGFYEGDFLLRAWIHNRDKSSINDFHHYRVWNPTTDVVRRPFLGAGPRQQYLEHSETIFNQKWRGIPAWGWNIHKLFDNPPTASAIPNYMFYPYFEYDVEDLVGKNYVIADPDTLTRPKK